MIRSRVGLHTRLVSFAWANGIEQVYFCPPSNVVMSYPCIVYDEVRLDTKFADNMSYIRHNEYELTVITNDADSDLPYKLEKAFPYVIWYTGRKFVKDNLYHYILNCRISTKL